MIHKILLGITLSALFVGCGGNKKQEQGNLFGGDGIESSSLNFGVSGSDTGKIPGLSSVSFETDQARLSSVTRQALAKNAEWLKSNSSRNLQIEGHCDERGSIEYNLALGERRAKAVKDYLINLGISSKRMSIISYGKEKPLSLGSSRGELAKNRRANFIPLKR